MKLGAVKIKSGLFAVLILLLFFQNLLITVSPVFSYLDEVLALSALLYFFACSTVSREINSGNAAILVFMLIITAGGLICNIVSSVQNSFFAIAIDVISNFKFVFLYLGAKSYLKRHAVAKDEILTLVLIVVKLYVLCLAACAAINLFRDIGMSNEIRYGLRSFAFVYGTPGHVINQMTYALLLLVAERIYLKKSDYFMGALCLFVMVCTTKTRAFVLAAIFLVLAFFFVVRGRKKISLGVAIFSLVLLFFLGFSNFHYYFTTPNAPRKMFLDGAVLLMKTYFPLGTGFATFGSSAAADYYSDIYIQLGFSNRYGMTYDNPLYLNDNYFPMVFGQFGILFGLIFCAFLVYVFIYIVKDRKSSSLPYVNVATLFFVFDCLFSCIQSSYLAHYSVIALAFIFMLFFFPDKEENKIYGC